MAAESSAVETEKMKLILLLVSAMPSVIVSYLMLCRLNARKWSAASPEGWTYLFFLGGAIYTFYIAFVYGFMPTVGKFMMDIAACIYFGSRSLRVKKWQRWRGLKH